MQLLFMFVELVVGWWTNSLGLISDAGHMFFDNASLFIGLYASYMAKWRSDEVYTYGYDHLCSAGYMLLAWVSRRCAAGMVVTRCLLVSSTLSSWYSSDSLLCWRVWSASSRRRKSMETTC